MSQCRCRDRLEFRRLVALAAAVGITQVEVATASGLTCPAVSRIVRHPEGPRAAPPGREGFAAVVTLIQARADASRSAAHEARAIFAGLHGDEKGATT
jgi:hypothetical protein